MDIVIFSDFKFCVFILLNLLVHYGCSPLAFPRPMPPRSPFGRNIYRRSRKDGDSVLQPIHQPLPDLWNFNNFEDVVAAVAHRMNLSNSAELSTTNSNETKRDALGELTPIASSTLNDPSNTAKTTVMSNVATEKSKTSTRSSDSNSSVTSAYHVPTSSTVQYSHSMPDTSQPSVLHNHSAINVPESSESRTYASNVPHETSIAHTDGAISASITSSPLNSFESPQSVRNSSNEYPSHSNSASDKALATSVLVTVIPPTTTGYSDLKANASNEPNMDESKDKFVVYSQSTLFPDMSIQSSSIPKSFPSVVNLDTSDINIPTTTQTPIFSTKAMKSKSIHFTHSYDTASRVTTPETPSDAKIRGLGNRKETVQDSTGSIPSIPAFQFHTPATEMPGNLPAMNPSSSNGASYGLNTEDFTGVHSGKSSFFYTTEVSGYFSTPKRKSSRVSTGHEGVLRSPTSLPTRNKNDTTRSKPKPSRTDTAQGNSASTFDSGEASRPRESVQSTTPFNEHFLLSSTLSYKNRNNKPKPFRNSNARKPLHNDTPQEEPSFTTHPPELLPGIATKKSTGVYTTSPSSFQKKLSTITNTGMRADDIPVVSIKYKSAESLPDFHNESRSNNVAKSLTTSTTTTTPYPPQNDVPWHSEHHNIPMSDSKEDADVVFKVKKYEDDPFIEPPIPFAEPGPEWQRARKQWGVAWELHIYLTGPLFAIIATYSAFSIFRLLMMPNLQSRGYFISLNFMMFAMGITRAIYLMHDAYNSNNIYPPVLSYFLFNISNPCLTSSFAILFLALLEATKLRLLPPRIQKPVVLVGVITFHFSFSTATDIIVGSILGAKFLLFVCHLVSLIWAAMLSLGYFYIYRKLYKSALRKQGELIRITFTRLHIDGGDLPKRLPKARLGLAVKVTLATAIFAFIMAVTQLYGMACIFEYFTLKRPDPWPWWSFHFICRLLELSMCATMSFIATQPVRHFDAASTPACVTTAWLPCSVFVGCSCPRKDPMMTYSNSCLTHHSFRNPGFSSTLDTPRRNWEQTSFQPQLQAVTLERKDLSLITDEEKSKSNSLQSLNSIKKSVISADVDSDEMKNSCAILDDDSKVASLARSTKSEKASMLYRENGFVRFRTEQDPEQPMEDSDGEGGEHEDSADDRFSTMATAGSVVHSISDEDQFQKAVSQLYTSGYWSPRARRLSRASMDTTLESGMNSSIDYLNNLVFIRAGMSNSAQEIPVCRYGSTCSSESAGNSFDVYLHDTVRSSRQNSSSSNLNCAAKRRIKNNAAGNSHHRESFLSSSDNDNNDLTYDLTSEDCATRSLLSHGDIEETASKDEEGSFVSPCCQSHNDGNSSSSSCNNCKAYLSSKSKSYDDAAVRDCYLTSVIPMIKVDPESVAPSSSFRLEKNSASPSALKTHVSLPTFQNERSCVFTKIDEDAVDETPVNSVKSFADGMCGGAGSSSAKCEDKGEGGELKLVHLYQKAGKSQSVGDLSKFPTHWDAASKTKKHSRNLWQKLRGSTFSLNSSLQGYEPLTTEDSQAAKRCGSDITVQRSSSDRRPQATSTVKTSRKNYGRQSPVECFQPGGDRFCLEDVVTGSDPVLVLDPDRCSYVSDVSV